MGLIIRRMTHPSIITLGYSEAAMFLRRVEAGEIGAVISIHGRRENAVEVPAGVPVLGLEFDDAEAVDWSDPIAAHRAWVLAKWAAEIGRPTTPPRIDNARAIIEFARSHSQITGAMLCQCQAGMSRSTAAALLCLAAWTQAGEERECVAELIGVRPSAVPLMTLVRFGDEVLGREGKLVKAVVEARAGTG